MIGQGTASVGKTVYSSGGYAPNVGRVSGAGVQGYIAREKRNAGGVRSFGADGQSDTRSGIAAKALGRNQAKVVKVKSKKVAAPAPVGAPTSNVIPQQISTTPTGQLTLPYSAAWSQSLLEGVSEGNASLEELQAQEQQQQLEYAQAQRTEGQNYENQQRSSLNTGAAGGSAFSSAYGQQVGTDARNHNNTINDLNIANTNFQNSANAQRTNIYNSIQAQMAQDSLNYADELAQNAGNLGYGTSKGKVKKDKNTSVNKSKAKVAAKVIKKGKK